MTMNELYEVVKKNYETMLNDMSEWEEYGEDYREEERMYDEGYSNALHFVMELIKEVKA